WGRTWVSRSSPRAWRRRGRRSRCRGWGACWCRGTSFPRRWTSKPRRRCSRWRRKRRRSARRRRWRPGIREPRFAVLLEHAAVHRHEHACLLRALRGGLVDDAFLHPDGRDLEGDGLVDVRADEGGAAEAVDRVQPEGDVGEALVYFLAEDLAAAGPHRDDA